MNFEENTVRYAQISAALSRSRFRSRFRLGLKDRQYICDRGWETMRRHAAELVEERLAPAFIPNDGKQTPMRGHPVFIAQHATACCCRGCLEKWHKKADGKCSCDYSFHMSIVEWNEETENEIQDMIDAGITSFKLYMTYPAMMVGDGDIYKIIKKLNKEGCFAGVHCENAEVIDALSQEAKVAGRLGPENHPLVRPDTMEAEAVHRLLVIAEAAGAPVMIVHLTNRKAYQEVMAARARGQIVYVETCPHYLLLDDSKYSLPDFEGARYVCAPPLRKKEHQECLWKALANGQIQTVATDHCSFTLEQRALGKDDFTKIPGGLPGIQTRGSLLYTYGVRMGRISQEQMCSLLCENPAKLYGVYPRKGVLAPGSDADIVIFDPEKESSISAKTHACNTDNTPFEGFALHGDIDSVFLRGTLCVSGGRLIREKQGTYIHRDKNSFRF